MKKPHPKRQPSITVYFPFLSLSNNSPTNSKATLLVHIRCLGTSQPTNNRHNVLPCPVPSTVPRQTNRFQIEWYCRFNCEKPNKHLFFLALGYAYHALFNQINIKHEVAFTEISNLFKRGQLLTFYSI